MELEKQVVSLELAKKIDELGFRKDSLYAYYGNAGTWHDSLVEMSMYKDSDEEFRNAKLLPAYTVAELGEILQDGMEDSHKTGFGHWTCKFLPSVTEDGSDEVVETQGDTEANARAMMLIYLLENNLIAPLQPTN